jgi:hypothetical protein
MLSRGWIQSCQTQEANTLIEAVIPHLKGGFLGIG